MVLVAVTQMTSGGVIRDNLAVAAALVCRAADAGAKAVFLPEATDFIAAAPSVRELVRSPEADAFVQGMCEAARMKRVWISVGVHERPPVAMDERAPENRPPHERAYADTERGRCFNTQLLIDDEGTVRERYRKLHLYDVDIRNGPSILESRTTIAGDCLVPPVDSPVGRIGVRAQRCLSSLQMLTCYDMRFPEPSLALRARGAHILTYPSAFAVRTGAAHWQTLLQARAIDTQCWVFAAAQVVTDGQDMDALTRVRAEMPLWEQRRSDVY
ncbi:beta-ureidopropionase [Malassezia sp. CBS 17886]|nr:beta-ureidopropionase [Malassezia sp. CBS 17886]